MTERPIIFSAPMVRAILSGSKSQTRRVVKGLALEWLSPPIEFSPDFVAHPENDACTYGQPGDRLWVRESFCDARQAAAGRVLYRSSGDIACGWKPSIHMPRQFSRITLEITGVRVERLQDISEADAAAEGVTPEWEPGCSGRLMEALGGFSFRPAASAFADLWQSLHGPGSWDANPWVWVIEFKRLNQTGNT